VQGGQPADALGADDAEQGGQSESAGARAGGPVVEEPPALTELVGLSDGPQRGRCVWSRGRVGADDDTALEKTAALIAEAAMRLRCEGAPQIFDLWLSAANGDRALDANERLAVEPFVRTAFGLPGQELPADHIQGYVAELIWYLVASELVREGRTLRFLKGPDFHVTGPGGDGLAIYDIQDALAFRLWEIKKHHGDSPVSGTVSRAYDQLSSKATEYLAQLTALGRYQDDEDLRRFFAQLVEIWVDAEPGAGAGVAVSTSAASMPKRCFSTMGDHFPDLTEPGQLEGLLVAVGNFPTFADEVKRSVWKGL
jgi:hypothetical protein